MSLDRLKVDVQGSGTAYVHEHGLGVVERRRRRPLPNSTRPSSGPVNNTAANLPTDALPCFYKSNVFKVSSPRADSLICSLMACRVIRTLWIDIRLKEAYGCWMCDRSVELYFEKDQWTKTVEFIRDQMPELRHLHVNFYRRKNSMRARYCKLLFEERVYPSLMKMREMPCFQLVLNFNSVAPDKAPFKVIYVAKEGYETGDEVVNEDEDDGEYEWLDEVKDPEDIDEWTVSFH
ncbi:hypothetical protein MauCBS54593_002427 [Microsporum audouinii]